MEEKYIINGLEISKPAPVIIPTLCRYNHLKNLLESLSNCHGAQYTSVYIALDYPAKPSHVDGYKKICVYLDSIDSMGFKEIVVIKRERNYGFGPKGNIRELQKEILKVYDRYIFTEDDNTFAYAFLDFMNYNLEKYANDSSILAISGYMYPIEPIVKTYLALKLDHFSAWGYGTWRNRSELISEYRNSNIKRKEIIKSIKFKKYCRKQRLNIFTDMVGMCNGTPIWGDALCTAMQIHLGLKSIFPTMTLVKNTGWDGSGTHGGVNPVFLNQTIDKSVRLENYEVANSAIENEYNNRINNFFRHDRPLIQKILTFLTYNIYNLTGKYYNFNGFRKYWKLYFRK